MTLPRLWAFLAVGLPVLAALIANLPSVDLTYHLRAGAEILAGNGIPTVDTWTFTAAGTPWTDQQWGAQVILGGVYQVAGWTGLVILRAALIGVIFGCLFLIGVRRGLGMRRASWLTLAAFIVSAVALGLRPQLIGMALFAIELLLVTDRRAHPDACGRSRSSSWSGPTSTAASSSARSCWGSPGSRICTTTCRGPTGCSSSRSSRRPRPASRRSAPPSGLYAVGLSTNPEVTARITEWQPTSLRSIPGILFFGSALAVVVLIARRGRVTPWPTLAWLAVFFLLGAYAIRGVAWWPLGAVAAIAGVLVTGPALNPARPEVLGSPLMRRLNLVVAGAIVLAGIALLPIWRPIEPGLDAPAGVVGIAPPGITTALARDGRRERPAVQPAAVGFVVRVRPARPTGRHRFAHRALPGRDVGRVRERRRGRRRLGETAG